MITITQGDDASLVLTATTGAGVPINLTGASFSTQMRGPNGAVVTFDNSKHTANADQVNSTGQFTLALNPTDTGGLAVGSVREIITKITLSGKQIFYHGVDILTVLEPIPLQ